jgi:hypothetical protein
MVEIRRRSVLGMVGAVLVAPAAEAAVTPNSTDHWLVVREDHGHGVVQYADENDFQKWKREINDNTCGICGGRYLDGNLTLFRSGWRYAPVAHDVRDRERALRFITRPKRPLPSTTSETS